MEGNIRKAALPWEYAARVINPAVVPKGKPIPIPTIFVGQVSDVVGVRVSVNLLRDPKLIDAATALANALNAVGIIAERVIVIKNDETEMMTPHVIHVIVGMKP
jgi:hypothetical protein